MPELPEVETIRRQLEPQVVDLSIEDVEIYNLRSIRRHSSAKEVIESIKGAHIDKIGRRGKYLLLHLQGPLLGFNTIVIHLGMSGQLLIQKTEFELKKHTHFKIQFNNSNSLCFVDPRTFGEVFLDNCKDDSCYKLQNLGLDPIAQKFDQDDFAKMILTKKTKLKNLLMDQSFLCGIGNIYSDEILFDSKLRYDRSPNSLSKDELKSLYTSICKILEKAIVERGSSLRDEQYRDLFGEVGQFQKHHKVHARQGKPCYRCGHAIMKTKVNSRSCYFCSNCQN